MQRFGYLTGFVCLVSALGACEPSADTASSALTQKQEQDVELCRDVYARARTCTDDFLPALVHARIERNIPDGIAQAAREQGEDALMKTAREEWLEDGKDDNAIQTCHLIVAEPAPPNAEQVTERARECLGKASCAEFSACIVPVMLGAGS